MGLVYPKCCLFLLTLTLFFPKPLSAGSAALSQFNAIPFPGFDNRIFDIDSVPLLSNKGEEDKQFRLIIQAIENHLGKKLSQEEAVDAFIVLFSNLREHFEPEEDFVQAYPGIVRQIKSLNGLAISKTPNHLVLSFSGKTKEISLLKNLDWIAKETINYFLKFEGKESGNAVPVLRYLWVEACLDVLHSPYNHYIYADQLAAEDAVRMGKTFGPGLTPKISGKSIIVHEVFDPNLQESGLVEGSVLNALDGEALTAENGYLFNKWLQPDKYTYHITFQKDNAAKTVEAEAIPYRHPTLAWAAIRDIVYIRIAQFSRDSLIELRRLFRRFKEEPPKGLVIDLRGNTGGTVNFGLVDCFFKPGQIIGTYKEISGNEMENVDASIEYYDYPVALLVDERSASMSEVFTAAFLTHKRGVVIGEKTFGKGVGQSCKTIGGEGSLCLVEDTYYYPGTEKTWNGDGISPDIHVEVSPDNRDRIDEFLHDPIPDLEAQVKIDPVLGKALSILGDNEQ